MAPESREGLWDLGGDPHAHPPRGKAGSGPSGSGGHFDPKIFAQLLQEDKGENGVRNEPDSSRNEALRQQEGAESVCACPWLSQQPSPGSSRCGSAVAGAGAVTPRPPRCTQVPAPCASPSGTCTAVWEPDGCSRATAVVPGHRLSPTEARACNTSGQADKSLIAGGSWAATAESGRSPGPGLFWTTSSAPSWAQPAPPHAPPGRYLVEGKRPELGSFHGTVGDSLQGEGER